MLLGPVRHSFTAKERAVEQGMDEYVFLLYGDNADKVNKEIREKIKRVASDKSMILIATGQKIGECFAVIDNELVWHGGMNLLGKVDAWDNLIRIKSESVAQELMGMMQEEMR